MASAVGHDPEITSLAAGVHMLLRRQRSAALRPFLHDWPNEPAIRRTHSSKRLPVLDWAGEAVTVPAPATAPLVRAIAACMERLAWAQSYTEDEVDRSFLDRYGWSELIGMRGPIPSDRLACPRSCQGSTPRRQNAVPDRTR